MKTRYTIGVNITGDVLRRISGRTAIAEFSMFDVAGVGRCDILLGIEFDDGTAIACVTSHNGPYSEVTPDLPISVRRGTRSPSTRMSHGGSVAGKTPRQL